MNDSKVNKTESKDWLSDERQYARGLGHDEVMRIKDPQLRELRLSFIYKKRAAFEDEIRIPDSCLGEEIDRIEDEEQKSIKEFIKRKSK